MLLPFLNAIISEHYAISYLVLFLFLIFSL